MQVDGDPMEVDGGGAGGLGSGSSSSSSSSSSANAKQGEALATGASNNSTDLLPLETLRLDCEYYAGTRSKNGANDQKAEAVAAVDRAYVSQVLGTSNGDKA